MGHNNVICTTNNVYYLDIRKAMMKGARTGECAGCRENLEGILTSVCGCAGASLKAVIDAIKAGADTVEKVGEATGAGTDCGKCKGLIQNIIDLGR